MRPRDAGMRSARDKTVNPHDPDCTWEGCAEKAAHPMFARDGEQWAFLCNEHKVKFDAAFTPYEVGKVLSTWVKAQGGAKAAAARMTRGKV